MPWGSIFVQFILKKQILYAAVKWYGTLCTTTHNMVVSAYEFALVRMSTQGADLTTKSR